MTPAGAEQPKIPGLKFGLIAFALVLAGALLAGQAMAQTVRWEDYRGSDSVGGTTYTGPAGAPTFSNNPSSGDPVTNLRALAVNPANAVRTGTGTDINYRDGAVTGTYTLCDIRASGGNVNSPACSYQEQGRVAYALIQFPQAGTYTIAAAHDDNVVVELSPDYTNTNYRAASYSILAGAVGSYSANENDYQTFGNFTAPNANSCALIRIWWTNAGGLNYNRLQWTTPNPGSVTQIIPASAFKDPAAAASSANCNGSITTNTIQLNKVIGSPRRNANDQFTVLIDTNATGTNVATATTAGSGTGQQASANLNPANLGTTYYLREVMASGSSSTLTQYTATMSCTRNGAAYTPTQVGSANNRRWSISTALGSDSSINFICTITNTAPAVQPTVTVNKVSTGGTGTFSFTGSNGIANHTITTSGDSVPTAGTTYTLTTASTTTTVTESAPPAGWTLQGISCSGLGSGGTATPTINGTNGGSVSLNAAATASGSAIVCTFTNRKLTADLSITKTNGVTSVVSGGTTIYTIRVTNNTGADTVTGAIFTDPAVTGLTKTAIACSATPGQCTAGTTPTIAQLQSGYALPALAAGQFYEIRVTCTVN